MNPTPVEWRHVRIVPHGNRFKLVTFHVFMEFVPWDLQGLGLEVVPTSGLELDQAIRTGQQIEDKLASLMPESRKRGSRFPISPPYR